MKLVSSLKPQDPELLYLVTSVAMMIKMKLRSFKSNFGDVGTTQVEMVTSYTSWLLEGAKFWASLVYVK